MIRVTFADGLAADYPEDTSVMLAIDDEFSSALRQFRGSSVHVRRDGIWTRCRVESKDEQIARLDDHVKRLAARCAAAETTVAAALDEVDKALAWHPNAARPNYPPDLAGCPPSALKMLRRLLGGGA